MAKIVLTRVDNRLVHGQVGVTWTMSLKVDTLVVVDDETVMNPFSQKLMQNIAKSSNVGISFYSVEEFANRYKEVNTKQQLFLIIKTPSVAKELFDRGVPITKLNLGNMHYERNKRKITNKVYLDDEDSESIKYLLNQGVSVFYQDVPGSLKERINENDLLKGS